jgi:NAD(P)-dependent dehydrogenase (short-subunit alcohol dehydrogenase family)
MIDTNNNRVVLITGGSSGIGYATTLKFAREGFVTYTSSRNITSDKIKELKEIAKNENLKIIPVYIDLNDTNSIDTALSTISAENSGVDVLISNAAFGYLSTVEDTNLDKYRTQFETNVIGTFYLMQKVIPHMRDKKNGLIINISSIMGFSTAPLNAPYSSSKYALESISETLALEVKPFGINVVIVQPGNFHTSFMKNAVHQEYEDSSPYYKLYKRKDDKSESVGGGDPSVIADLLLNISNTDNPKLRYVAGKDAFLKKILHTVLPGSLWIKFLRFIYKW